MNTPGELQQYVDRPDASYRWQILRKEQNGAATAYELELVSQTWQGDAWKHLLRVFVPEQIVFPDLALLSIGADAEGELSGHFGHFFAEATGAVCAFLYDVPNQPLFDGLIEDALIAHTLVEYLNTLETDWPLLFPMTKSAVRAMDALQEWGAREGPCIARRFVVTGASKRGWTSWLAAASDARVAGIIPWVYDNLNLMAQMPHQREVFSDYSSEINAYTEQDLPAKMATPEGAHLALAIDPYTYRERLNMPKLIVNAANDPYWPTDALNLYWNELPNPKNVLYVPNATHSFRETERVYTASLAFFRAVARGENLPQLGWEFVRVEASVGVLIQAEQAIEVRIWTARSDTRDFRASEWRSLPTQSAQGIFTGEVSLPASGYIAVFAEAVFEGEGFSFPLSSQIHISPGYRVS